jgi:hypothetical protein
MSDNNKPDCCKDQANLMLEKSADMSTAFVRVMVCKVCGRHHFGMTVKPVEIKTRLEPR